MVIYKLFFSRFSEISFYEFSLGVWLRGSNQTSAVGRLRSVNRLVHSQPRGPAAVLFQSDLQYPGHNRFPHFLPSSGSAKNLTNQSCLFLLNRFDHSYRLLEFPGAGWAGIPRNEILRRGYLRDRPVELFDLNPYQCNNRGSFQIHYTQGQLGTANNKFGVVIGTHFDVKQ